MKALKRVLLVLGAALAAVIVFVFVEFAFFRGVTPSIDAEQSIASLEQIELGGVQQWVLVRGHDVRSPLILFLHGGPGMPAMYLAHAFQSELERDFVVVHWDRRGAGKSFDAAALSEELSVRQTLADTHELTRRLLERFGRERLYLAGHSWGSYLGLLAVRDHPEYYSAFVGMGQIAGSATDVERLRREFLIGAANAAGDSQVASEFADPERAITEDDLFRYGGELRGARSFWPVLFTGLRAPEYTFADALNVRKGAQHVAREMQYDMEPGLLEGDIPALDVPVFLFLGRHDYNTPSSLAADYLDRMQSPLKGLVWFENSAHFPFFEEPQRFHREWLLLDASIRDFQATVSSHEPDR